MSAMFRRSVVIFAECRNVIGGFFGDSYESVLNAWRLQGGHVSLCLAPVQAACDAGPGDHRSWQSLSRMESGTIFLSMSDVKDTYEMHVQSTEFEKRSVNPDINDAKQQ